MKNEEEEAGGGGDEEEEEEVQKSSLSLSLARARVSLSFSYLSVSLTDGQHLLVIKRQGHITAHRRPSSFESIRNACHSGARLATRGANMAAAQGGNTVLCEPCFGRAGQRERPGSGRPPAFHWARDHFHQQPQVFTTAC